MRYATNLKKAVRTAMANLDVSQFEYARRCEITAPYLSAIINGKASPTLATIERMALASGMTLSEFLKLAEG